MTEKTRPISGEGEKDSHPAAEQQHQREGLFRLFQQLHGDEDEGAVVKAPKCLAQRETERERERGTPRRFIALAAIRCASLGTRKTKNGTTLS